MALRRSQYFPQIPGTKSARTERRRRYQKLRRNCRMEGLEERMVLAVGPVLVGIIPNRGDLLQNGDLRHEAPRELTFRFQQGEVIDSTTLAGIRLQSAGVDGILGNTDDNIITPGYLGVNTAPDQNEVVMRFAEPLVDDKYRIRIFSTDAPGQTALRDSNGLPFNMGVTVDVDFELDLGAQVIAVVPQPITRNANNTLTQARNQIVVYFNNDDLNLASAQTTSFYQLIFTNTSATTTDDVIHYPQSVAYDATTDTATLTFSTDLALLSTGAGTYRLRIGNADPLPLAPQTQAVVDTGSDFATATDLGQLSNRTQLISSAIDPEFYPLQFPGSDNDPGHTDSQDASHFLSDFLPDATPGITTQFYNFQEVLSRDALGFPLFVNLITEIQKQRAREVFQYISHFAGIQFVETSDQGFTIATGDLAIAGLVSNPGGVIGVASATSPTGNPIALMDSAETGGIWGNSEAGGAWFQTAMHEIGHLLGLGHADDLPPLTIMASGTEDTTVAATPPAEDVFPGDGDIVHLQELYRPESKDIDIYKFRVDTQGVFSAELVAERLENSSQLNGVISIFDHNGNLISRNDDYYGEDSYVETTLLPGDYYVAITSTGNTAFDPRIVDSGMNGTTQGKYDLRLNFKADQTSGIKDATGTLLDGDLDGTPGGAYNFWFEVASTANTIYIDKASTATSGTLGTLARPYTTIAAALAVATPGKVVRIVGNNFANDNGTTPNLTDNLAYEIGRNSLNQVLADGETFRVPQGVTVMVDAGAVFKLRRANIDVGSFQQGLDRSLGHLQVLGTPTNSVYFTSYQNETVGKDTFSLTTTPSAGDWGGIIFRNELDYDEGHTVLEDEGIFLNYVNHANLSYGGGDVVVNTGQQSFSVLTLNEARPTLSFNYLHDNAIGAISADPNSFKDNKFHDATYESDYERVGPSIVGNRLLNNAINGLFISVHTLAGQPLDKLEVTGRFDDDIVHVITEQFVIQGSAGGRLLDDATGNLVARNRTASYDGGHARLTIDPGIVVKMAGARFETEPGGQLIAEGRSTTQVLNDTDVDVTTGITFTSLFDNRFGASGTFQTAGDDPLAVPNRGDWGGIYFGPLSLGSIDRALITYAGGSTTIEGDFAPFNAIEIQQAQVRIAHTTLEENADGFDNAAPVTDRNGRGTNGDATIFVRGAQPAIVDSIIRHNDGDMISINVNSLNSFLFADPGRSRGNLDANTDVLINHGPYLRNIRAEDNDVNGLVVRGGTLTTQSVWDDTDIVHVVRDEIYVPNFHAYGGLLMESRPTESLVIKLAGATKGATTGNTAGFTAGGSLENITDRIGGSLWVVGQPGRPVVFTSLADDSVGAGLTPAGNTLTDTNNDGNASLPTAGDWRSIKIDEYSNDRNVEIVREAEEIRSVVDVNGQASNAQQLAELGPSEKDTDDNRRLGFEIHGIISTTAGASVGGDVDVYSFKAKPGTEVWIDIDRTSVALDTVLELIDGNGNIVASSQDSVTESANPALLGGLGLVLEKDQFLDPDFYTLNTKDAGMRVVLPGGGTNALTYYVRVRASSDDLSNITGGISHGAYTLQIRLQEQNELPGSTVQYADIRYATRGIEVLGKPEHSPLLADSGETTANNNTRATAQSVGSLTSSGSASIGIAGSLSSNTDLDWYSFTTDGGPVEFDIDYADGMGRPDLQLSIFDASGQLILVATDSNIAEDRPGPLNGSDITDLSRGSVGGGDPFLGPVNLPIGTYYVAVSHAVGGAATLSAATARREPINSLSRIVEDHISFDGGMVGNTPDPLFGTADDKSVQTLALHADQWFLGDVSLYVNTPGTVGPNLFVVDPFSGQQETSVGNISGAISTTYNDLVMRSDGFLYTIASDPLIGPSVSGNFIRIDTGNAAKISTVDDQIVTYQQDPQNLNNLIAYGANGGGVQFEAIAIEAGGQRRVYAVGNIVQPAVALARSSNLLYILDSTGVVIDDPSDNNPNNADLPTDAHPRGRLLTGQSIVAPNATDIFGSAADQLYADPGDVRDGTRIQVTSEAGLTLTFELDSGPDILTSTLGAEAIRDGNTFTLSDGNFTRTFEFNTGPVLVLTSAGAAANAVVGGQYPDGQTFTIADTAGNIRTFEIENPTNNNQNGVTQGNVAINLAQNSTQAAVVAAFVNAINNANNLNVQASFSASAANLGRISLTNDALVAEAISSISFQGDNLLGRMLVLTGATGANLVDGDTFTIVDNTTPANITKVFQLDNTDLANVPTPGAIQISFTSASTAAQISALIAAAINGAGFAATAVAQAGQASGRIIIHNSTSLTETGSSVEFENVVGMNLEETASFATMDATVTGAVSNSLPTIRPGSAHRTGSVAPNPYPTVGDRITFYGATLADFAETPSWTVRNNLFNTGVAATGIATSSDLAIPFAADDTAQELAQAIATAINAASVYFPAFGVTANARGDVVELVGAQTSVPLVVDLPLSLGGGGPGGTVTGLAELNGVLYAVTDAGGLYIVNNRFNYQQVNPDYTPVIGTGPSLTYVATSETDLSGIDFEGLTVGPPNVEDGLYADMLFAIAGDGQLYAFNTLGELQPIFIDGNTSVDTGLIGPHGLAFSTLDYNLWNPTNNRGTDSGHGIDPTYDDSRTSPPYPTTGGMSFYFGLEDPTATTTVNPQPGAGNYLTTNSGIYNSYNLPDGAHGSLTTNTFSLKNYTAQDQPTLYFNYYYEVGSSTTSDMVKVYASSDGANWSLVTNSLTRNTGSWRQARVSLASMAGQDNVRLRFDFSTAGDLEVGDNNVTGSYLTALPGTGLKDGDTFTIGTTTFEFDMGFSLLTPAGAGRTVRDSETYTVVGPNGTAKFELDIDGHTLPGNVPVAYTLNDSAAELAARMADAINLASLGVAAFAYNERVHLEDALDVNVFVVPQVFTVVDQTNGYSLYFPTGGGAALSDGETFRISGPAGEITFELDSDGIAGAGNVPLSFTNVTTANQLATNMALAINGLFPLLGINAVATNNAVALPEADYVVQNQAVPFRAVPTQFQLAPQSALLNDGDTFTLVGPAGTAVFEMDSNGIFDPTHLQVPYLLTDTDADLATKVADAINTALVNNAPLGLIAVAQGTTVTVDGTILGTESLLSGVTTTPSRYSLYTSPLGGAGVPDGTLITLDTPAGLYTFELDSDGISDPGYVTIPFTVTDTAADLATNVATEINNQFLGTTATPTGIEIDLDNTTAVFLEVPQPTIAFTPGVGFSVTMPEVSSLIDGDLIKVVGPNSTVIFEFDNNQIVTPGYIALDYTAATTPDDLALLLANAINSTTTGVTGVAVADTVDFTGALDVTELIVPSIVAEYSPVSGFSLRTPQNGGAGVTDGQIITVTGPTGITQLELDNNSITTAGNRVVTFTTTTSAGALATLLANAINTANIGIVATVVNNRVLMSTATNVTVSTVRRLTLAGDTPGTLTNLTAIPVPVAMVNTEDEVAIAIATAIDQAFTGGRSLQAAGTGSDLQAAAPGVDFTTVAGSAISDGQTFNLTDGVISVTFEMDAGGGVNTPGNIAVTYAAGNSAVGVANAIAAAINNANTSLGLNITALVNGSTVSLKGPITIYDRGSTAFLVANDPLVDGQVFTINDGTTTFTFEIDLDGNTTLGNQAVALAPFDPINTVAQKIANAINLANTNFGMNVTATVLNGTVTLRGTTVLFQSGSSPLAITNTPVLDGQLFTLSDGANTVTFEFDLGGGVSIGNTAVLVDPTDDDVGVAAAMVTAINLAQKSGLLNITATQVGSTLTLAGATAFFDPGTSPIVINGNADDPTYFTSVKVDGDRIRVISPELIGSRTVTSNVLPHSLLTLTGQLPDDHPTNLNVNRFFSAARGQDNNHEGFYVDDLIIGMAERGEMVTNAGTNDTVTSGASNLNLTTGPYDLEIRKGNHYTVFGPLANNFDSNDRLGQFFDLQAPAGAQIQEGETFTINDGSHVITFEFDSDNKVTPGNRIIPFKVSDTDRIVATTIRDAINFAKFQGATLASAAAYTTGNVIQLVNVFAIDELAFNVHANQLSQEATDSTLTNDFIGRAVDTGLSSSNPGTYSARGTIGDSVPLNALYDIIPNYIGRLQVSTTGLADAQTFTLSDGTVSVTFEIETGNGLTNAQNIPVAYTPGNTVTTVATAIAAAINSAHTLRGLAISAAAGGSIVVLTGDDAIYTQGATPFTWLPLVTDGQLFTVNDGTRTVTFEFENLLLGDGVTLGNRPVTFAPTDSLRTIFAAMMTALNNARIDTTVALDVLAIQHPTIKSQITLLGHNLTVSLSNLPFLANQREGLNNDLDSYKAIRAPAGNVITDGQTFVLSDGVNVATFEFDNTFFNDGVAEGHIEVDYTPFQTSTNVASAIAAAIAGAGLNMTASSSLSLISLAGEIIVFDHGNTPITQEGSPRALDVDFLKVQLDVGETLEVDIDSDGNSPFYLDSYLRLFDELGNEIVFPPDVPVDDAPAPGEPDATNDAYFTYTATVAGVYYIGISGFGNEAYNPLLAQSGAEGDVGNYSVRVNVGFGSALTFTAYDYQGDANRERDQGYTLISGNRVSNSLQYGIAVDNATRDANGPHPGTVRNLLELNTLRQVPGVAVTNNVIDGSGIAGILLSGDTGTNPQGAVPFTRVMNNTIYGAATPAGIGIQVTQGAAPTLLNNIVANLAVGIQVDATSSAVIGGTAYQFNTADVQNPGTGNSLGSFPIPANGSLTTTTSFFVNAAGGNFYPATNSLIIDSSINSLPDRANLTVVQQPLGISQSPILAPERDFYGLLRVNDPAVPSPSGLGSNVFKDRGAIDRADFTGPSAQLLDPVDNDGAGVDRNANVNEVDLVNKQLDEFAIQIVDGVQPADPLNGTGVDDATVTSANVTVTRDGGTLVLGTDYTFTYDANNNIIRLVPLAGIWLPGRYVITLNNQDPSGIRDLASNLLKANQTTGETLFKINVGDAYDFGDLPSPYATLLADNGARHKLTGPLYLGQGYTSEFEGQPSAAANADAFDDGVTFPTLTVGSTATIIVNASAPGKLDAFIDFNNDGDFTDAGEKIANGVSVVAGNNSILVTPPTGVGSGTRYARFRISTAGGLGPTGEAADGEVEDYQITIKSNAPFQNPHNANDVNNNNFISNLDAFLIITELRVNGPHALTPPGPDPDSGTLVEGVNAPPYFWDVSGNNFISNLDALLVISDLRANGPHAVGEGISALAAEGEGEGISVASDALAPVSFLAAPTAPAAVTPALVAPLVSSPVISSPASTSEVDSPVAVVTPATAPAVIAAAAPASASDEYWSSLGALGHNDESGDDFLADVASAWEAELVEDAVFAKLQ